MRHHENMMELSPGLEPEERVLLDELNHRVNNEFATAIGFVSHAAANSGNREVKVALARVSELLHHYADMHRALQSQEQSGWIDAAAYLRELCLSIGRATLDYRQIKLAFAGDPLPMQSDRCWRLGLIVYELVANAARHAFAGGAGEIRVELLRAGEFVECRVSDDGSVRAKAQPGRGLKIVGELARSLDGRFQQHFGERGSKSILVFPRSDRNGGCEQETVPVSADLGDNRDRDDGLSSR